MKNLIRALISRSVHNDRIWRFFYHKVVALARYIDREREKPLLDSPARLNELVRDMFSGHKVRNGPFKGMIYPAVPSSGGAIYPKLIGSYERELNRVVEEICARTYPEIIDVGCAEGYYAVGFALRKPETKVYAYDVNEHALRLCGAMAKMNQVQERVITGSFCSPDTLRDFQFTRRALIMSDCEGYEYNLFAESLIALLSRHDLLIEVHDFTGKNICTSLIERFHRTHVIESIQSIADIRKAQLYDYPELSGLNLASRFALLAENRPATMEWLYLKSRVE